MVKPEDNGMPPAWEAPVVGMIAVINTVPLPPEEVVAFVGQSCRDLLVDGRLANLGLMQKFLRERMTRVQLVAHPFKAKYFDFPVRCIDPISDRPRGHWLMVSVGGNDGSEIDRQLARLSMSHEVNEATLAHDTGLLQV